MSKLQKVAVGITIAVFGIAVFIGNAIALSTNPFTWVSFVVGAPLGCLICWYGWAVITESDWE